MIKAKTLNKILHKCIDECTILDINVNGALNLNVLLLDFNIDTRFDNYYNLRLFLSDNSIVSILLSDKWGYQSREALLKYKHNGPVCYFEIKVAR